MWKIVEIKAEKTKLVEVEKKRRKEEEKEQKKKKKIIKVKKVVEQ